ncbi:hypothetical protein Xfasm12_0526 [Xylella fastidiosa M12]|nr:hypothetical protein Xfasm12_0526 [Xylella fastidiosa M12]
MIGCYMPWQDNFGTSLLISCFTNHKNIRHPITTLYAITQHTQAALIANVLQDKLRNTYEITNARRDTRKLKAQSNIENIISIDDQLPLHAATLI